MQSRHYIFKLHDRDNVGTALQDLEPGELVTVVAASGVRVGEQRVASFVPRYFKLALDDLGPGSAVIKWGRQIGRIHRTPPGGIASPDPLGRGTAVHLGNFAPSIAVVEAFGDGFAAPCTRLVAAPGAVPFEVGKARRGLQPGDSILVADVEPAHEAARAMLTEVVADSVIGVAVTHVKKGRELHWGALGPSRFHFERTDGARLKERVEQIRNHYRFLGDMQRLS